MESVGGDAGAKKPMIIEEVQLYTTRLADLEHFYSHTLGMDVSHATEHTFHTQVGSTRMIFITFNIYLNNG